MKTLTRPLFIAFWVTLIVLITLAILGITTVTVQNLALLLAVLALFALLIQLTAFLLLHNIDPKLRHLRNELAVNIILSLFLLIFTIYLIIAVPASTGVMNLVQFVLLLFFCLSAIIGILGTALYFVGGDKTCP